MWTRTQILNFWREEIRQLVTVQSSDRPWQLPVAAALATGLPLLVGAWFGHLAYGLVSSLGGLAMLYLPRTPLHHRMVVVMAAAFGMTGCYALGLISHQIPALMMPMLVFITLLVTMVCRFYRLGPPGNLFFIMAASIGAYSPADVPHIPLMVGLLAMGTLLAVLIGFFYSLHVLRFHSPLPVTPLPPPTFDGVVVESVVIALAVGASLGLAQIFQMEKAYWVPVSCLAVIQGASLRAVWSRQLHRILGTAIGLAIALAVLSLPLTPWTIPLIMMALTFVIETAVVRHYAFAAAFITPMAILLAEAATLGHTDPMLLVHARFVDTCLGSVIGLAGGYCLHHTVLRSRIGTALRRLIPARFLT
ncbi:FUSC family protein [Novispirillum itersonii]|uniref:FUSC family protein n=1 Tax=Novispirillum itersonii TaxID=189 RepID=UPI00037A8CE3|nr:FUSC family protein [Novispirillum itersonii]